MMKIYREKETGKKLYPVCSWQANQHKLYNAVDRCYLAMVDSDYSDKEVEAYERAEKALEAFDRYIVQGIVYATWEDRNIIKDYITAYDVRTDELKYNRG